MSKKVEGARKDVLRFYQQLPFNVNSDPKVAAMLIEKR